MTRSFSLLVYMLSGIEGREMVGGLEHLIHGRLKTYETHQPEHRASLGRVEKGLLGLNSSRRRVLKVEKGEREAS